MKYKNEVIEAIFIDRPNRFIANVKIDDEIHSVHVKNTGRCRELLIEGVTVFLERANNPNRKTQFSLVAVYKGDILINIDSQAPNKIALEALKNNKILEIQNVDFVKSEKTYGNSRFDLYYEKGEQKGFIEIKGVTLEDNGYCLFPDAPTERGKKHIKELIKGQSEGYVNFILFVIQIEGVKSFSPNNVTDPNLGDLLIEAEKSGVQILCYDCIVKSDELVLDKVIPVVLL